MIEKNKMIYLVSWYVGDYSGAAVVALDLVKSLAAAGKNVGIICNSFKVNDEKDSDYSTIKKIKAPYAPRKKDYPNNIPGYIKYIRKCVQKYYQEAKIALQFYKNPPDALIFNDNSYSINTFFFKHQNRCRTIRIIHESPKYVKNFKSEGSFKKTLKLFNKTDVLVFVSEECRKEWLSFSELNGKKTYYIPNCADEKTAAMLLQKTKSTVRKTLEMRSDKFYLTTVANIQPRKGQDLLIEAAPKLKEIAPNLEILIIGNDSGAFASKLKERVSRQGLSFVRFLGRKNNAMTYLYASDAFILTSRAEALPLVVLESMVLKTPVISSQIDGVPEMIEHKKTGALFESESIESLLDSFQWLYNNEEKRHAIAENSYHRYWTLFSSKLFAERYKGMIEEV